MKYFFSVFFLTILLSCGNKNNFILPIEFGSTEQEISSFINQKVAKGDFTYSENAEDHCYNCSILIDNEVFKARLWINGTDIQSGPLRSYSYYLSNSVGKKILRDTNDKNRALFKEIEIITKENNSKTLNYFFEEYKFIDSALNGHWTDYIFESDDYFLTYSSPEMRFDNDVIVPYSYFAVLELKCKNEKKNV